MLDIYQHPTEKNPTLGYTFYIFSQERFDMHYEKYSSLHVANHHLTESKIDVIVMNLEAFNSYCDKTIEPLTQVHVEAMKTLRDTINNALDNKEKYEELLSSVVKKTNFIRSLTKALPPKKIVAGIMMAATIIGYCNDELDEHKKNKG